jgi:hypothetical protein
MRYRRKAPRLVIMIAAGRRAEPVAMRAGKRISEARMTITDGILIAFALLIGGILLPVSSGVRSTLVLALIALTVLAALGGGMHYVLGFFG